MNDQSKNNKQVHFDSPLGKQKAKFFMYGTAVGWLCACGDINFPVMFSTIETETITIQMLKLVMAMTILKSENYSKVFFRFS